MRALLLLIMLGALATPAQAQSRQVIGYAGVLGEWELTATVTENVLPAIEGVLRTADDEAHRCVHAGWPGGEDRRIALSVIVIPIEGDIASCRRRVHLQRKIIGLLFRHDELPGPKRGSAQAVG